MLKIMNYILGKIKITRRKVVPEKQSVCREKFFIAECERKLALSKAAAKTNANTRTALRSFKAYLKGDDVPVEKMTKTVINGYERWILDERGVSANTAALYLRSLRAIYNKVMKGGKRKDIFSNVRTTPCPSASIEAASVNDLKKIAMFHSTDSMLEMARDIFMFSFHCMGMPFVDVFSLQKNQIRGGTLTYRRHKTGVQVTVTLTDEAQRILRKYSNGTSRYVFPLERHGRRMEYATALRLYNRSLKELETSLSLKKHLSSYVARHTWATLAYSETCDMNIVAGALGHTNTKVTMTYVTFIQNKKLAATNRKIIRRIKAPAYSQ